MAQVIWAEPALNDAIADYIALDNLVAAAELVRRIFRHDRSVGAACSVHQPTGYRGHVSRRPRGQRRSERQTGQE